MSQHCLNCDQPINTPYCPNCGQAATTHRFSLKYFFVQVVVQGVLQLEQGFFYTLKALFTRPGHSIREYIQGKRVKHFNYFTFLLLIITIGHVIGSFSDVKMIDIINYSSEDKTLLTQFEKLSQENPKLFILIQLPFLALFSFLFFRKSQQNYTEHLVLNSYKASAELLIATAFTILTIFYKNTQALNAIFTGLSVVSLAYSIWFYYQYFSVFGYSKLGLLLRSILTSVVLMVVVACITAFVLGVKAGIEDAK